MSDETKRKWTAGKTVGLICGVFGSLLVVLLALGWFRFFYTGDLVFFPVGERAESVSVEFGNAALIGTDGNCYVRTMGYALGLTGKQAKQYKNRFNRFWENTFVRIYGGGDARDVFLFPGGGAIVTDPGACYLVLENNEAFAEPAVFCENAKKAILWEDRLYVLTDRNELGRYPLDGDRIFAPVLSGVCDFAVLHWTDRIVALRENGELLLMGTGDGDPAVLRENVKSFSAADFHVNDDYYAYAGGVDADGAPFLLSGSSCSPDDAAERLRKAESQTPDIRAKAVAVYKRGFLALTEENTVLYYGRESFFRNPTTYDGAFVCGSARMITGDGHAACIVKNDGSLLFGGDLPCDSVSLVDRE